MNLKEIIKSQYHAAFAMLRQAVEKCPDTCWLSTEPKNKYWRIAFHAIFYTHLYLQPTEADFSRWSGHRDESQFLGKRPWPPHEEPTIGEPYTRQEILTYLDHCNEQVNTIVDVLDLDGPSGFEWLPFDKTELQFYNIRHLQQHTGELCERLGNQGIDIDWIGMTRQEE